MELRKAYFGRRSVQDAVGTRGSDAQIRAGRECVSARALVNELLSSSKVCCMCGVQRATEDGSGAAPWHCGDRGTNNQSSEHRRTLPQCRSVKDLATQTAASCCSRGGGGCGNGEGRRVG